MKSITRLETIIKRQRNGQARDLVFACFVALIALAALATIGAAMFTSRIA